MGKQIAWFSEMGFSGKTPRYYKSFTWEDVWK